MGLPHPSLDELKADLLGELDVLNGMLRQAVPQAVKVGQILLRVKETIRHGVWLQWVERNTKLNPRTAQIYMHLATHMQCLSRAEAKRISHLGLAEALAEVRRRSAAMRAARVVKVAVDGPLSATPDQGRSFCANLRPTFPSIPSSANTIPTMPDRGGPASGPVSDISGDDLLQEIIALRNADVGGIDRLKKLRLMGCCDPARLELLDDHIRAQTLFLEGLQQMRARLVDKAGP